MSEVVNDNSTRQQSLNAYNQWCVQWREHAKFHSQYPMKPLNDFDLCGVGKALLCIGNGASFEDSLETIKKYQGNVDILVCDKTLGHCLDNGIIPTYCMVCDANVNFERYLEPHIDKCKNTILFSNVCGNMKWTDPKIWKDMYFFVNSDVLNSELEFSKLSGCKNFIPAATNVSGEMIVLITQCDNSGRRNAFGYDKILLTGFDYSWEYQGRYYSFNEDGDGKTNYMRHLYGVNQDSQLCFTSNNLYFSMEWLKKYINTFKLPVVNCSKKSILDIGMPGKLEEHMKYTFHREDVHKVKELSDKRKKLHKEMKAIEESMRHIAKNHHLAYVASL